MSHSPPFLCQLFPLCCSSHSLHTPLHHLHLRFVRHFSKPPPPFLRVAFGSILYLLHLAKHHRASIRCSALDSHQQHTPRAARRNTPTPIPTRLFAPCHATHSKKASPIPPRLQYERTQHGSPLSYTANGIASSTPVVRPPPRLDLPSDMIR